MRVAPLQLRNPWLAALLLVAFLGRSLVPVGYMPGPAGLMLCPAHAGMSMPGMDMPGMDMAGMDPHAMGHHGTDHPDTDHAGSCSYAAAASGSALATVHSLPPVAYVASAPDDVPAPPERLIPRGTIVPTRLPRGPPAHS